jgi:hydroxyacid-oxoacid transhydrogenase
LFIFWYTFSSSTVILDSHFFMHPARLSIPTPKTATMTCFILDPFFLGLFASFLPSGRIYHPIVHLAHGMSYPISSQVKTGYRGYADVDHAMIAHGHSVILAAPAVFRFTGVADPARHATCARILAQAREARTGGTRSSRSDKPTHTNDDAGAWLADEILELCHVLQVPMGLQNLGYTKDDIPALVEGTLPQHRVTKISPRPVGREELELLFLDAMEA